MARRGRRDEPEMLLWTRVALFFLAAGVWLVGAKIGEDRLVIGAVVLLAAGALLRFYPRGTSAPDEDDPEP